MFRALLSRIKEGCRTGAFPPGKPNLPPDFRGRPKLAADTTAEDVDSMRLDMFLSFGSAKAFLKGYTGVRNPITSKVN